jgi:Zn-dependent peptidase ImmA (M78 family)/transcriptional regulator with XRE-family HTH domain
MTSVAITGEVFRWARERAGLSDEKLAKSVSAKLEKIRAWETGKEYPNFQQAQKLASALSVPLGYLFLSHPPQITIPVTDFRTLPGKEKTSLSPNLQDVLDDALRKRDWYKEWRQQEEIAPFEFVGKYSLRSKPVDIVQNMRQVLDIPPDFTKNIGTWDLHLRQFVQKVESAGILVLQSGIVGNNTRRKLSVQEFRGFALADKFAPLVFINAQDSTAARIFTLAHELAHVWTGTSGISNPEFSGDVETPQTEKLCNQIAAEFLVPYEMFVERWDKHQDTLDNAQQLARYFRVSTQVVLRRAFDAGFISVDEYRASIQEALKAAKPRAKGGGGDFYNTLFSRNSRRFTTVLLSAVSSGHLSYLDGARLLNTRPGKLVIAMEKMR